MLEKPGIQCLLYVVNSPGLTVIVAWNNRYVNQQDEFNSPGSTSGSNAYGLVRLPEGVRTACQAGTNAFLFAYDPYNIIPQMPGFCLNCIPNGVKQSANDKHWIATKTKKEALCLSYCGRVTATTPASVIGILPRARLRCSMDASNLALSSVAPV